MDHIIMGLSHIGIKTTDSEKSVDFYKNLLGFQHYYSFKSESGFRLDFLRLGGCIVELIYNQNLTQDDMNTEGTVAHLALEVLNIDGLVESLKKAGVDTWQSENTGGSAEIFPTGIRNIFFKGPSGELIEFMEHTSPIS
jgi:lactoylglutathione lyase